MSQHPATVLLCFCLSHPGCLSVIVHRWHTESQMSQAKVWIHPISGFVDWEYLWQNMKRKRLFLFFADLIWRGWLWNTRCVASKLLCSRLYLHISFPVPPKPSQVQVFGFFVPLPRLSSLLSSCKLLLLSNHVKIMRNTCLAVANVNMSNPCLFSFDLFLSSVMRRIT